MSFTVFLAIELLTMLISKFVENYGEIDFYKKLAKRGKKVSKYHNYSYEQHLMSQLDDDFKKILNEIITLVTPGVNIYSSVIESISKNEKKYDFYDENNLFVEMSDHEKKQFRDAKGFINKMRIYNYICVSGIQENAKIREVQPDHVKIDLSPDARQSFIPQIGYTFEDIKKITACYPGKNFYIVESDGYFVALIGVSSNNKFGLMSFKTANGHTVSNFELITPDEADLHLYNIIFIEKINDNVIEVVKEILKNRSSSITCSEDINKHK